MADRTCARCGKIFKYPYQLASHKSTRKTPCAIIVESADLSAEERQKPHPCKFCGRRFMSEQGMWRHVRKNCKVARTSEGMEHLYKHTLQRQLDEQRAQIAEMAAMMHHMQLHIPPVDSSSQPMHQTARTINNAGVMLQLNVNVFGNEDMTHIGRQEIKALLDDVLRATQDPDQGANSAFLKTAMLIYSDPAHPENLT
jgi:hypothetical protein